MQPPEEAEVWSPWPNFSLLKLKELQKFLKSNEEKKQRWEKLQSIESAMTEVHLSRFMEFYIGVKAIQASNTSK